MRGEGDLPFKSQLLKLRLLLLWYSHFCQTTATQREFVLPIKEWHEVSNSANAPILGSVRLRLRLEQLSACVYAYVFFKIHLWTSNMANSCPCLSFGSPGGASPGVWVELRLEGSGIKTKMSGCTSSGLIVEDRICGNVTDNYIVYTMSCHHHWKRKWWTEY